MVVAVQEGLEIWQVDFVSTYLNSIPEHKVYMKLPPGFLGEEGKLARLWKTIYGLMQGGFDWYWTLDSAYRDLGYKRSCAGPCVCFRLIRQEATITNTLNNDTFRLFSTKSGTAQAKAEPTCIYKVKDISEPSFILGIAISHNPCTGLISLLQKAYIIWVLERFNMENCNPCYTPLPSGIVLINNMSPKNKAECAFMADKPYCKLLGVLKLLLGPIYHLP